MHTVLAFVVLHSPMCSDLLHQCTRENTSAQKTLALILSDFYMHSTENGH